MRANLDDENRNILTKKMLVLSQTIFRVPSTYNTNIDFLNDKNFDIEFSVHRIKSILNTIDVNKAHGFLRNKWSSRQDTVQSL